MDSTFKRTKNYQPNKTKTQGEGTTFKRTENYQSNPINDIFNSLLGPAPKTWNEAVQSIGNRARQNYLFKLKDSIKYETLGNDFITANEKLSDIYSNWQSPQKMKEAKPMIESMYKRLNSIQKLTAFNGEKNDESFAKIVNTYKNALDEWDERTEYYKSFKSVDAYNEVKKKNDLVKKFQIKTGTDKDTGEDIYRGLTYDEVKEKIKKYSPDSEEYKYLSQYTDYTDLKEFDKAIKAIETQQESERQEKLNDRKYQEVKKAYENWNLPKIGDSGKEGNPYKYYTDRDVAAAKEERENWVKAQLGMSLEEYYENTQIEDNPILDELKTKRNIRALDNKVDYYRTVMDNKDFKEKSKYIPAIEFNVQSLKKADEMDLLYEYINNRGGEKNKSGDDFRKKFEEVSKLGSFFSGNGIDLITDDEISIFNYLKNKDDENGTDNAKKFLQNIKINLNKRKYEEDTKRWEKWADSGFWAGLGLSLYTVLTKPIGSLASGVDSLYGMVTGEEYNPYSSGKKLSNFTNDTRKYISENISEATEGFEIGGVNIPSFLYNTGMSMTDSALGVSTMGVGYTPIMAMDAFSQKAKELKEAGENQDVIFLTAAASGLAEAVFEYISLDKLLKIKSIDSVKKLLKSAVKQAGVEASEEFFTEFSNIITDSAIRGDSSELAKMRKDLKELGYTDKEINTKIAKYIGGQLTWASLGGFISGGVMGAGAGITSYSGNKNVGTSIKKSDSVDDLLNTVKLAPMDSEAYSLYKEYTSNNKTDLTNAQIGNLYNSLIGDAKTVLSSKTSTAEQKSNALSVLSKLNEIIQRENGEADNTSADRVQDDVRYSINFTEEKSESESKKVIKTIFNNIKKIKNNNVFSVKYSKTASDFKKKSEYVLQVFNEQGNLAHNDAIGDVELIKSGAKSTIMHGFGNEKLAAVEAIKPVIENGDIISFTENYNDTGVDRYIIAGKGKIGGEDAYVGVVIKSYPRTNEKNRFYLHEAEIIKAGPPLLTAPVDTVGVPADYTISQDNSKSQEYYMQESGNNSKLTKPDSDLYNASKNIMPSNKNKIKRSKLTLAEKQTVKRFGEALGFEVEFFNAKQFLEEYNKGRSEENKLKVEPEAYTSGKTLYLAESCNNPIAFLLAHEFTDSVAMRYIIKNEKGEIVLNKQYKKLIDYMLKRKVFLEYARSKNCNTVRELIWTTAENREAKGDSNFVGKESDQKRIQATIELLSDFVGEKLTTDIDSLIDFANNMNAQQRNAFVIMIKKFLARIKASIQNIAHLDRRGTFQYEINQIERKLAKLYQNAPTSTNTQKENTADSGVRYKLAPNAATEVENALNNKNYTQDVYLTENSPSIITSQKGVRNLPMLMKASHIRENVFTEQEAKEKGLKVDKSINYHGLGKPLFLKIIDGLDNVKVAYRGTKNADNPSRSEKYFLLISEYKDSEGNTINVPIYINDKGQYNRVVIDTNKIATVFGKSDFNNYINKELKNGNIVRIKNKSNLASELKAPIASSYSKNASDLTIPQDYSKSQDYSMQENKNNSTEEDIRFYISNAVEETRNLIAIHNINESKLLDALNKGVLIGPSIAIKKSENGYSEFGDISIVLGKEAIDPQNNKNNKLYGADAWTPAQTALKINPKFDNYKTAQVIKYIKNTVNNSVTHLFDVDISQFRNTLKSAQGSIFSAYAEDLGLQTAYAIEKNLISEIPIKNGVLDKDSLIDKVDEKLNKDAIWRDYKIWLNNISDEVITEYDEASTKDILNNMALQPDTAKVFNLSESGELTVPVTEYKSIDEMRSNKNRLSEDAESLTKAMGSRFLSWANEISQNIGTDVKLVIKAINSSFSSRYQVHDILSSFNKKGVSITRADAISLQNLYKQAAELPAEYFEAKPQRAVGFDEVAFIALPYDASQTLRDELTKNNIEFVEYETGNKQSRINALNTFEDVRFSFGQNTNNTPKENTADSGVRYKFDSDEILDIQSIGEKSLNNFTAEDIKKSKKFAIKYFEEMGVKSPFFRSWFGDWRLFDTTKIDIATKKGNKKGLQKNIDTGWEINVSSKVKNETNHKSLSSQRAIPYLEYIDDIVEKAILLDTWGMGKTKSPNSLLMHSFYCVADIGNGPELLKLYVEEMNNPNLEETTKRAYKLKNIEKSSLSVQSSQTLIGSSITQTAYIKTIADLARLVKSKDTSFKPKTVIKELLNANGTPKIFYHGTKEKFTEFKLGAKNGWLGKGIYFAADKSYARTNGKNVVSAYLKAENPFMVNGNSPSDVYSEIKSKYPNADEFNFAEILKDDGYDSIIFNHWDNGLIVSVFEPTQIKSANDNIGTFDGNNRDIRFSIPSDQAELLAQYESGEQNSLDLYTEEQYNNYGWVRANDIMSAAEYNQFSSYFADHKVHKHYYVKTRYGESIIPVGKNLDVLVYASGDIDSPKISKVIRINESDEYYISQVRSDILEFEKKSYYDIAQNVAIIYGEEILRTDSRRDFPALQELKFKRERSISQKNNSNIGEIQNGRGSVKSNNETKAGLDESAFSSPKNKDIRYSIPTDQAELLTKYENGEITREEYLEKTNENYGKANERYGIMESGENPTLNIAVPNAVEDRKLTRRFARTIVETGEITDEMLEHYTEHLLLGDFSYSPISDDNAQAKADIAIKQNQGRNIWNETVYSSKHIGKDEIAVGEKLLLKAIKDNDTKRVLELSAELSEVLTRSGQVVQAARMLKKMSGVGKLMSLQKTVDKINSDLKRKYKDKAPVVNISDIIAQQLIKTKPGESAESIYQDALTDIAAQVPSTFLDKWNAWRYTAMLANPRTHIRNLIGNAVFTPTVRIKDLLSAGLEAAFVEDSKRTKSAVIKKQYKDFAAKDTENGEVIKALESGGKFNIETTISENQRIFKNAVLEFVRTKNSDFLEAEDMFYKNRHYKHALAGFLQARKVDLNSIDNDTLMQARVYAVNEAMKATFNDLNKISSLLSYWSHKNKFLDITVNALLPFKKTPINIVKRGIEYSPIGLIKSLTKGVYDLKIGKKVATENGYTRLQISGSQFIDGLGAGISGTAVFALGMLLKSLGVATGGLGDSDEDKFKKLNGQQEYSLNILGISYTIDWSAPASIPFFMGVEFMETLIGENEDFKLSDIGDNVWNALEPVINLSMLSGIQDTLASVKYEDTDRQIQALGGSIISSYFGQALPTIGGQLARTTDTERRTNYIDKNSQFSAFAQSAKNSVISKIPALENTKPEYVNAWGQTESSGNIFERIFGNFISPGYLKSRKSDDVSRELERLNDSVGEAKVFPKNADKSFQVNGAIKYLTADEYVKFAKAKGQNSLKYITEFINSSKYERLSDEERAEVIENLYKYANAKAKLEVSDYDITKQFKTVYNLDKSGQSPVTYYIGRALAK